MKTLGEIIEEKINSSKEPWEHLTITNDIDHRNWRYRFSLFPGDEEPKSLGIFLYCPEKDLKNAGSEEMIQEMISGLLDEIGFRRIDHFSVFLSGERSFEVNSLSFIEESIREYQITSESLKRSKVTRNEFLEHPDLNRIRQVLRLNRESIVGESLRERGRDASDLHKYFHKLHQRYQDIAAKEFFRIPFLLTEGHQKHAFSWDSDNYQYLEFQYNGKVNTKTYKEINLSYNSPYSETQDRVRLIDTFSRFYEELTKSKIDPNAPVFEYETKEEILARR